MDLPQGKNTANVSRRRRNQVKVEKEAESASRCKKTDFVWRGGTANEKRRFSGTYLLRKRSPDRLVKDQGVLKR